VNHQTHSRSARLAIARSERPSRRVAIPVTDLWRSMDAQARQQHDYQQAATGLVADLKVAGFDIDRLRELRRPGVGDPGAVPILVDWLSRATSVPLKCDIAYVLGSRWARPDGAVALIDEYQRLDDECDGCAARVRAAICTSLERIADDAVLEELCQIALDPRHGSQRGMAIVALGNMRRSRDERSRCCCRCSATRTWRYSRYWASSNWTREKKRCARLRS